ncbi:MAG TPA: proprotein convertase P-domain-containing protein, partial [Saprospiraceae bacterium]|nr:proprotein convertase P-domain-containing protein [Saprospiraceae bacterium]
MNTKSFTKFASLLTFFVMLFSGLNAQMTFNGSTTNTAGNNLIPSSGTGGCTPVTTFNCTVTGTTTAVSKVQINLTHTWDGDLEIYLQAPGGQRIALSTGNGGSADNYTNTIFMDGSPSITTGAAPFTGTFAPEGAVGGLCATPAPGTIATLGAFTTGQNGTWQLIFNDNAGGDSGVMLAWSITFVAPPNPCVLTCPQNITTTLNGGECAAFINFPLPVPSGQCDAFHLAPGAHITQNADTNTIQDALQCGVNPTSHWRAYDLTAMGVVGNFRMHSLGMLSWSAGTVQIYVYTYTGTLPAATLNTGQMTLVAQSAPYAIGTMQHAQIQLTTFPTIPAGSKFVVEQRQLAGGPWCIAANYQANTQPAYMNCIGSIFGFPAIPTSYVNLGYGYIHPVQVLNGELAVPGGLIVQTSGLPSGSQFPIGTTHNCFNLVNEINNQVVQSCCFNVTVNEFPFPTSTLACNDNVQVSVDDNCEAFVTTDMILEGSNYHCYDDYLVTIEGYGSGYGGVQIDNGAVGQTLYVTVYDPDTGNSCWGTISVEDKIPPVIECRDVTIMCGAQLPTVPAPQISGYQTLIITGLNDVVDVNSFTYDFDYSYLPSTPVLDVDVRIRLIDHTWLPDLNIVVESPTGTQQSVFQIGGCFGQNWPIDAWFDDAGAVITMCVDLNCNACHLQPLQLPGVSTPVLYVFNGEEASGVWHVTISDNFAGDDGIIQIVGLEILVDLPQADPTDNCGEVTTTYTDTQSGD